MRYTPSSGPGKILVVERDPAVALRVETILGTWEAFEVTAVSNATEAAVLLEDEPWDLILADFELPDAEALRLLSAVRTEAPGLPFAMLAANPVLPPGRPSSRRPTPSSPNRCCPAASSGWPPG